MLIITCFRRRSQVVKATVCKTVIPRFKSGRRLQYLMNYRPLGSNLFLDKDIPDEEVLSWH